MKTPLPDKLSRDAWYAPADAINQLIDYLAELTEVVEGKHYSLNK